jgi:hypothetical protein
MRPIERRPNAIRFLHLKKSIVQNSLPKEVTISIARLDHQMPPFKIINAVVFLDMKPIIKLPLVFLSRVDMMADKTVDMMADMMAITMATMMATMMADMMVDMMATMADIMATTMVTTMEMKGMSIEFLHTVFALLALS